MTRTFLCLVLAFGVALAAPARAQTPPSAEKLATVSGTITAADTGKPLRRARVALVPLAGRPARMAAAYTNSRGEYQLKDVEAGSYYVSAGRSGYAAVEYGQRHASERGQAVAVKAGAAVSRIDIALPRGGVLTGRITDDTGQPYPGVRVDLIALRYNLGRLAPSPVRIATTDDLGTFRLAGVAPGRYYLSATSNETWRDSRKEPFGYATTFYPGVPIDQAQLITVGAAEIKSELNFSLQAGRAARIHGRVMREDGTPVAGAGLTLWYSYPGAAVVSGARTTRAAADGSFEFRDVPGGTYGLGDHTLTVSGADLDDVVIVSKTGSTVSGVVVSDDGTPLPFGPSGVRVINQAPTGKVLPRVAVAAVDANWGFKFDGLGGPFIFDVMGLPEGWMVDAVRLGEKDITDAPWDVPTGGQKFTNMTIVVTRRAAKLTGVAFDDTGQPTSSASVLLFSEDEAHWFPFSRRLRVVRPDADGQFSIANLPPGTYHLVALDYVEPGQHEDREFLAATRDEGTRVVLGAGATETTTVRIKKL